MLRVLSRRQPRPASPLRSDEERAVRDAVLDHLLRCAAYADALPEGMFADYPPTPDPVLFTAAIARPMQVAVVNAGRKEFDRLVEPARIAKATDVLISTGFDTTDPRALDWAQQRAADLVTNVSEQQRLAIRQVISSAFSDQVTGPDTARRLRAITGLSTRYAHAVDNAHAQNLARNLKAGMTDTQAREAAFRSAQAYRDRLIRSRANTIARTEIMTAQNKARQLAWTQQVEDGHLSPYSRKRWVAHDTVPGAPKKSNRRGLSNPCRICSALHGQTKRWDEPWEGGYQHPPAHPNCRCVQVVLPPALPGDDDYLSDLSSPAIDRAVADSKQAWDDLDFNGDMIDLNGADGAVMRRRLWREETGPMAHLGGNVVPTQAAIDAVALTQRAGALIRRRSEARARLAEPGLYERVQEARRAHSEALAATKKALDDPSMDVRGLAPRLTKAAQARMKAERAYSARVNAEIERAIAEHRPTKMATPISGSRPALIDAPDWERIDRLIPDDWKPPFPIRLESAGMGGRAHAERGVIRMAFTSDGLDVYAHELMHVLAMENIRLLEVQWAYLGGRIAKNKPLWHPVRIKPLESVLGSRYKGSSEMYLPDAGMRAPYAAKVYGQFGPYGHSEVFSVAIQQLLNGYYPNPGSTFDSDAVDLLIGSLVSL